MSRMMMISNLGRQGPKQDLATSILGPPQPKGPEAGVHARPGQTDRLRGSLQLGSPMWGLQLGLSPGSGQREGGRRVFMSTAGIARFGLSEKDVGVRKTMLSSRKV